MKIIKYRQVSLVLIVKHFFACILCVFLFLLNSCDSEKGVHFRETSIRQEKIYGRASEKFPLYQICTPLNWSLLARASEELIKDTKTPLCTLLIGEHIRLTVHNFPVESLEDRIAPQAQVSRWKKQFSEIQETAYRVEPVSFNGYQGLFFQGSGLQEGVNTTVLGWSLQLSKEHFQTLSHPRFPLESRADITLKVVGPKKEIQKHQKEILSFAKTFSLLTEIPPPR